MSASVIPESPLEGHDLRPPPPDDGDPAKPDRAFGISLSMSPEPTHSIHPIQWWAAVAGIVGATIAALAFLFAVLTRYGILP